LKGENSKNLKKKKHAWKTMSQAPLTQIIVMLKLAYVFIDYLELSRYINVVTL